LLGEVLHVLEHCLPLFIVAPTCGNALHRDV
jgi:hypothetical protein